MLFLRIAASFALVGLMLWVFARFGAGRLGVLVGGGARGGRRDPLEVIDRRQLTKGAAVAVVRAGERHFLLGVTDDRVEMLAEGGDLVPPPEDPTSLDLTGRETVRNDGPVPDTDQTDAWTRSSGAVGSEPPRMNPFIALREKTVRRS